MTAATAMSFAGALRWSGLLLGAALAVQCAQHLSLGARDARLYTPRLVLAVLLACGVAPGITAGLLLLTSLLLFARFHGPYNGGSDRMGLLLLSGLWLAHVLPQPQWRAAALGYVAVQLVASYFLAGVVKVAEPTWRNGQALRDVFAFSIYPVSADLRALSARRTWLTAAGWFVMLFELAFPFALFDARALQAALVLAFSFHVGNAVLFGLDRFVWVWLAAYPTLLWFQGALIQPLLTP
jgi:hypothetical protein